MYYIISYVKAKNPREGKCNHPNLDDAEDAECAGVYWFACFATNRAGYEAQLFEGEVMVEYKMALLVAGLVLVCLSMPFVAGFLEPVSAEERFLESVEERIVSSRADILFMKLNGMRGTERYYTELEILVGNYELRDSLRGFN